VSKIDAIYRRVDIWLFFLIIKEYVGVRFGCREDLSVKIIETAKSADLGGSRMLLK